MTVKHNVFKFPECKLEFRRNDLGTRTELKLTLDPGWRIKHSGVDEGEAWITVEKLVVDGGKQ